MSVFLEKAEEFIDRYDGVYAETTLSERDKQFIRLNRMITHLIASDKITTGDPSLWSVDDAMAISVRIRRNDSYSSNYAGRLIGSLNKLCRYHCNMCFENAKHRYPELFPKKKEERIPILSEQEFDRIMRYCLRKGQTFNDLKASAAVTFAICGGLRPQEVQNIREENLDLPAMLVHLQHVKGMNSYGVRRTVPLHPAAEMVLAEYMRSFEAEGLHGYLFQWGGGTISDKTVRSYAAKVGIGCGVRFSLTTCRATWGQMLIDSGLDESGVSVLLGHASTLTTNKYYARATESKAIENARAVWNTPLFKKNTYPDDKENFKDWRAGGDSNPRLAA